MGIAANQLRYYAIRPTLEFLDLWSPAAENLLLGTAAQESLLGHYLRQTNGPALGIYQIEPATHQDIWDNYLNKQTLLAEKVQSLTGVYLTIKEKQQELITNLKYATAIARVIYYRIPDALPDSEDIAGLAHYWKKFYNTGLGRGKEQSFIKNYQKLCET